MAGGRGRGGQRWWLKRETESLARKRGRIIHVRLEGAGEESGRGGQCLVGIAHWVKNNNQTDNDSRRALRS